MARPPLAAILVILFTALPGAVRAQPLPVADPAPAVTPASASTELAKDFRKGVDLTTVDMGPLQRNPDVKARDQVLGLYEQAKLVQLGREPGDAPASFLAMIRSVARRLGVDYPTAERLYAGRVRATREGRATREELEARAAIATDIKLNRGIDEARRANIAKKMRATSAALARGFRGDGAALPTVAAVPMQSPAGESASAQTPPGGWASLPSQVQPQPLRIAPPPEAAPVMGDTVSFSSLAAFVDWERGKRVALEAVNGTLNWVRSMGSMCYRFVKQALIDAGVLDAKNPQSTGVLGLRASRAKFFSEDVRKNPEILVKMGYRRADISTMTGNDPFIIPDGSILNYAGGCSFADPASGHIELTVSHPTYEEMRGADPKHVRARAIDPDEVTVCHFSCTGRTMPFIRTYGTDGPPRRVKNAKGKMTTVPGRKACLNLYVPVKSE